MKTLYLSNLNEKVSLKILEKHIKSIFSKYGRVENYKFSKNIRMKGQGFIQLSSDEEAEKAKTYLQNYPLLNKSLKIDFANVELGDLSKRDEQVLKEKFSKAVQKARENSSKSKGSSAAQPLRFNPYSIPVQKRNLMPEELLPPNRILFIQHLPPDMDEKLLKGIFGRFPGFIEARLIENVANTLGNSALDTPSNKMVAFVEYENEYYAISARDSTNELEVMPDRIIKVSYARR